MSAEHPSTPPYCETHRLHYAGDECWKCRAEEPSAFTSIANEVNHVNGRGHDKTLYEPPSRRLAKDYPENACATCGWPPPEGWVRQLNRVCVSCNRPIYAPAEEHDPVNRPAHYTHGSIEVIDAIEDWKLGFHLGNVVKYVARSAHKGKQLEDLKKARWYLERAIAQLGGG